MLQRSWSWVVLGIGLLAGGGVAVGFHVWAEHSPRARAEAQRDELRSVRSALDECVGELDRRVARFWDHEERTTQLRARIESLESLDPEGVPADVYDEYMEAFDGFNEAIPEWEALTDSVRSQEQRCEKLADRHNEKGAELRRFLSTEGLLEGS